MTRDQIRAAINEGIPFEIRMADGAKYLVRERYQVAVGRTSVVVLDRLGWSNPGDGVGYDYIVQPGGEDGIAARRVRSLLQGHSNAARALRHCDRRSDLAQRTEWVVCEKFHKSLAGKKTRC